MKFASILVCALASVTLAADPPELESIVKQLQTAKLPVDRAKAIDRLLVMGEAAKPASEAVCNATLDRDSIVSRPAMEALEKINPELYRHVKILKSITFEQNMSKRLIEFGAGIKPARRIFAQETQRLILKENARQETQAVVRDLTSIALKTWPDDKDVAAFFLSVSGPSNRNAWSRTIAINDFVVPWASESDEKKKTAAPVLVAGFRNPVIGPQCISAVAGYGNLAGPYLKELNSLTSSTNTEIRRAATAAVAKLNAEGVVGSKK